WEPPALTGKALLHGHCHHRATGGIQGEHKLLERMGLEVEELQSGCCGMAGSWGYEEGHYEISMACGERVLLPRVREAPRATLVVADGFSCKEQIRQGGTGRQALHVAQVLKLARQGGSPDAVLQRPRRLRSGRAALLGAIAAAALAYSFAWKVSHLLI